MANKLDRVLDKQGLKDSVFHEGYDDKGRNTISLHRGGLDKSEPLGYEASGKGHYEAGRNLAKKLERKPYGSGHDMSKLGEGKPHGKS